MATLTDSLDKIKDYLWKPTTIKNSKNTDDAIFFDIRDVNSDDLNSFMEDTLVLDDFIDDLPEDFNLETKIFFGVAGFINYPENMEADHVLQGLQQIEEVYLVDIEDTNAPNSPVYRVQIDGTIMPDLFEKIADDISELEIALK